MKGASYAEQRKVASFFYIPAQTSRAGWINLLTNRQHSVFSRFRMLKKLLVTGSSGLIGSEVVTFFCGQGWQVNGLDNNMRKDFFGPRGDTSWNKRRLEQKLAGFRHHEVDIRDRTRVLEIVREIKPDAMVHAAAQPSHDLAATRPFDDFDVNAAGTLNMLEAARQGCPEATFIFLSTNKVYGDGPNRLSLVEKETRWDYADPEYFDGIQETFSIDNSMHSIFGASKVAADVMVQEYGRYFQMPTCCLRAGCLTGPNHSGVELHGFLSYLIRCNLEGDAYRVYGFRGKQVRDNIHSYDVAQLIDHIIQSPRVGEVYNLGGGRKNSISILEAFNLIEEISGKKMSYEFVDQNRKGDHICYISNLSKIHAHYPTWKITKDLKETFREICEAWQEKRIGGPAW
jgi:CDP-paratose 2-epimerase